MDINILRSAIETYFGEKDFNLFEKEINQQIDLRFGNVEAQWAIALCADQAREMDYLKAFESGMQVLISHKQKQSDAELALALSFESTLRGEIHSYRRALNKYSNSIVFEDLGIHLLLVRKSGELEHFPPNQVNAFLGRLNARIAAQKHKP